MIEFDRPKRYRVAAYFAGAWLLLGVFSIVFSLPGGHPPLGVLLWAIAFSFTLSGRAPQDPGDPCYMEDRQQRWLLAGGMYREDVSRAQIASVLDYWRACPNDPARRTRVDSRCK